MSNLSSLHAFLFGFKDGTMFGGSKSSAKERSGPGGSLAIHQGGRVFRRRRIITHKVRGVNLHSITYVRLLEPRMSRYIM